MFSPKAIAEAYEGAVSAFPIKEFNDAVALLSDDDISRFLQTGGDTEQDVSTPHCDPYSDVAYAAKSTTVQTQNDKSDAVQAANKNEKDASSGSNDSAGVTAIVQNALVMLKGMIQSIVAVLVDMIPPLIPPPIWWNNYLPCVPQLTGPKCLGTILYPIVAPDLVMGDITDKALGGSLDGFPSLYKGRAGKTSDEDYFNCASAFFGVQCSSLFPMCWMVWAGGKAHTAIMAPCIINCLLVTVMCPGFSVQDVPQCDMMGIPPFCSFAFFTRFDLVPPQLADTDSDDNPVPEDCPLTESDAFTSLPESPLDTALAAELALEDSLEDFMRKNNKAVPVPCDCSCYKLPPMPVLNARDITPNTAKDPPMQKWDPALFGSCAPGCKDTCRRDAEATYKKALEEAYRRRKVAMSLLNLAKGGVHESVVKSLGKELQARKDYETRQKVSHESFAGKKPTGAKTLAANIKVK